MNSNANVGSPAAASLHEQVQKVLDLIRPAIQSDGGDVELLRMREDGVVEIRLHGACIGCPEAAQTLHGLIERNLKQRIPAITGVHASGA